MAFVLSSCTDHAGATGKRKQELEQFKAVRKFGEDGKTMYAGVATETERLRLEEAINQLIDRLLAAKVETLDKKAVLKEFKTFLDHLEMFDSEDRDQMCRYLEKIMDIFNIESSDGLLNTWRYGFDPNKVQH
jgi:hypothetical protein